MLNARVSEWVGELPFFRINTVHHSVVLFPSPQTGVQHINHQVEDHDDVIIIGGQYNRSQKLFLNPAPNSLGSYAGNWMFTSGKGLTEAGLYKADMLTAVAEQQMLEQIDKLVVVVDSSKVGHRTGMLFCPTEKIDILITGKNANPEVIKAIEAQGTQVILV